MIETVMGELVQRVEAIHAVDVNPIGEYLQVRSGFEGDTELVAKVQVMNRYPYDEKIAIGDSLTDLNMALQTPIVFARVSQQRLPPGVSPCELSRRTAKKLYSLE